jgi:N-acetylneuraminic acid mutarotase
LPELIRNLAPYHKLRIIIPVYCIPVNPGNKNSVIIFGYDLWKFDGARWTWISGDKIPRQLGVYGTKGEAADSNKPGARWGSISWLDSTGNFWLFGGFGYDVNGNYGPLNDLWKFNGSKWTWISGDNVNTQNGVYGIKGEADDTNKPGSRWACVSWIDSSGYLWLFGGFGIDATGAGPSFLNDLWMFDGYRWTWMSGDKLINQNGIYGSKGEAAAINKPGTRDHSISWIDSCGNFWLFGGYGYNGSEDLGLLNDLWKYSPE